MLAQRCCGVPSVHAVVAFCVGLKLTLKLQLEPAASMVVQEELAILKSAALPPVVVAAMLVSVADVLLENSKD